MSVLDDVQRATRTATRARIETAVILAAGEGSRFRVNGDPTPKPLQELLGLTLVERAILRARAAGVTRFVVVVGYEADALARFLDNLAAALDITIETVLNPRWHEGNGTSALAAEPCVAAGEPFFLMMCDHVFPDEFLERLVEQDEGAGCAVVVDLDIDTVSDLEDATKVELAGSHVRRIGKRLGRFDAVDTGVFLCRPALFDALREAAADGEDTMSAGVQRLADRGDAAWVRADGLFWQDIDTPADLAIASATLTRGATAEAPVRPAASG